MSWIIKFIGSAALLLLAFRMTNGGHDQPLVTTTEAMNLLSITRYIDDKAPSVVLVGSSLAFRLSESYFTSLKVDNLALAGASSNTGLEIIAAGPTSPKITVVETNMIARPTNRELIDSYRRPRSYFSRPIRLLAQKYESWLHRAPSKERANQEIAELLSSPPSNYNNQQQIARSFAASFSEYPVDAIETNLVEMKQLISALEARGSKVILFDVPMPPDVDRAPFIAKAKQRVRSAFPNPEAWLNLNIDTSTLRWTDGAHLDKRSAVIVARAIEASASELLPKTK